MTKIFKNILICILLLLNYTIINAQTYIGIDNEDNKVIFKIKKDSSITFAFAYKQIIYKEYTGRIFKIQDSLYHIEGKMSIGNDVIMCSRHSLRLIDKNKSDSLVDDSIIALEDDNQLFFTADSSLRSIIDTVFITYSNGIKDIYLPYNKLGEYNKFYLNKNFFNDKAIHNYLFIRLNRPNQFTNKRLKYRLERQSSVVLKSGEEKSFDVIFSKDKRVITNKKFKLFKKLEI